MDATKPVTIALDRPREIKWSQRAKARLSSLKQTVRFEDLAHERRGFYALCTFLWAALIDRDHPFDAPEDMAEFLITEAQQVAAFDAFKAILPSPQKKTEDTSQPGPSPSSRSASEPATSTSAT